MEACTTECQTVWSSRSPAVSEPRTPLMTEEQNVIGEFFELEQPGEAERYGHDLSTV